MYGENGVRHTPPANWPFVFEAHGQASERGKLSISKIVKVVNMTRLAWLNKDTWSVELASAGVLCLWGAVLLMPYSTFTSNAVFRPMLTLMPHEWVWGVAFLTFGLIQLVALRRNCPRWRGYSAAVNAAPYMFLAASHFIGSPLGVVFGVYFVFVLCNWWAAWAARPWGADG